MLTAGTSLAERVAGGEEKISPGFHQSHRDGNTNVVKQIDGRPSIVDDAVTKLGQEHGFDVTSSKDGLIFDSKDFRKDERRVFFTTVGSDDDGHGTSASSDVAAGQRSPAGTLIDLRTRFCRSPRCAHTFHTSETAGSPTGNIAHGDQSDPYLRMLGGEFILHSEQCRFADLWRNCERPKIPGLEGVTFPSASPKSGIFAQRIFSPIFTRLTLTLREMR